MLRFNWGRSRSAHLYCARKFTRHVIHPVPSSTCYRADGHCYSFTWIQRPWTFGGPYFLFMDPFLHQFSMLKKNKQNLSIRSLIFFAKCIIELRSIQLFVCQCGCFKFLLKGWVFWKRWQHLEFFFLQQTHFYKIWLRSFASVDSPSLFWTIHPL